MCDTMGSLGENFAIFAKNSDRSPNEPQVIEFIPAKKHLEKTLKATYIEIDQIKETNSILISRPSWMWGAEIGVNEHSVAIGNEAVFTKGTYGKSGLTGMDLLRLALERSESAYSALEIIINLLEQYGQGGNCGYDHSFFYNNSFLIMDKTKLYVLETVGKEWSYKEEKKISISNRLCLTDISNAYSREPYNFAKKHSDPLYSHFSGSKNRREQTSKFLTSDLDITSAMKALRTHAPLSKPFTKGSVKSTCMHAGGLVGDHTTSALIANLDGKYPELWITGCSSPCISLFKPYLFGNKPLAPVFTENNNTAKDYWLDLEIFNRKFIGHYVPDEYYSERDALENQWIKEATIAKNDLNAYAELAVKALNDENAFIERWNNTVLKKASTSLRFKKYWKKKNNALR